MALAFSSDSTKVPAPEVKSIYVDNLSHFLNHALVYEDCLSWTFPHQNCKQWSNGHSGAAFLVCADYKYK